MSENKPLIDEMNEAVNDFYKACDRVLKVMAKHRLMLEEHNDGEKKL